MYKASTNIKFLITIGVKSFESVQMIIHKILFCPVPAGVKVGGKIEQCFVYWEIQENGRKSRPKEERWNTTGACRRAPSTRTQAQRTRSRTQPHPRTDFREKPKRCSVVSFFQGKRKRECTYIVLYFSKGEGIDAIQQSTMEWINKIFMVEVWKANIYWRRARGAILKPREHQKSPRNIRSREHMML